MSQATLYDAPGPRTRRRTQLVSVAAGVALLGAAYLFVYRPLADHGQFTAAKWSAIVDPDDPNFRLLWQRIGTGARNTLTAAALAVLASLAAGVSLAVLRVRLQSLRERRFADLPEAAAVVARASIWLLNAVTRFCVETFRGLPVVITIFFVARGLPEADLGLSDLWYLVIGLSLYNSVVIGEILRSGMVGLPPGQREAALALGLSPGRTVWLVQLPQAVRVMLPALISQLVVVLKDTSIGGVVVGYDELLKVGSQAVQVLGNPIQIYAVIGALFIAMNYALSRLARYLQARSSQPS